MKFLRVIFLLVNLSAFSQPLLVNNDMYAFVKSTAYDSINNKIYFNVINGCPTWGIPCALNYSLFSQHSLINMHNYTDNDLQSVQGSKYQVAGPIYPVSEFTDGVAIQSRHQDNSIYSNFGYYFNRINEDLNLPGTIWSYTPATNPSYKQISTFEIKGDSVFLFERDSSSTINYYTVYVKNKLSGGTIPFSSLLASAPNNSLGAIEGKITSSVRVNDKIVLAGMFTASVSGNFIGRNLVYLNTTTGQLSPAPVTFTAGSAIYDMKIHNNKIHIAGLFAQVNNKWRNNYAVLDYNLNLKNDSCYFNGDFAMNTYLTKIAFYDKYMIALGNYWAVAGNQFAFFFNIFTIKAVDLTNNTVMPWTFSVSGYPIIYKDQLFDMHKNKLYIKRRDNNAAEFLVYCFEPVNTSLNILYPGSNLPNPSSTVALCAPDNGDSKIFIAPIRYATTYNWMYSGSNATIVPLGNGSTAKLVIDNNSTNGVLSVTGYNDCSLSSQTASLNVTINAKPTFTMPSSPLNLNCNPDSTLLQASSTNSNTTLQWRLNNGNTYYNQPFFAKIAGNYRMRIIDNVNSCSDSGMVTLINNKIFPNAKITSHVYPGPVIPIDTITCFQPMVNITGASDTSGVAISWKSIAGNSVYTNPISVNTQINLKLIVTRTSNACVDSSMIVLIGQNNTKPLLSLNNYSPQINCSIYTASLIASVQPSNCIAGWTGPQSFTSTNPANTNAIGKYYVNAFDPVNGCTKIDSVSVIQTNSLLLNSSNDTTVCKFSNLNLTSSAIGTLSGITFSWNTGATGNNIFVNPGNTFTYVVSATGPGGCAGSKNIKVIVPTAIQDSLIAYRNCDDNSTGTLLVYAKGGIPPYKYSLNGSNFSANSTFTNLPFATYSVQIKDSIGCMKSATVSVNAISNLPVPKFLASTKNFRSDTIVLVDISVPRPDSVKWLLPNSVVKIGGDQFNPILVVNDTGSFVITMKGYFGKCIINSTKTIRFGVIDSTQANAYNANGIKSCILYPNPNTGQFTIQVEFYNKQSASIQVWNTEPIKYFQQNFYDTNLIQLPVNLSQLQNGSYLLRVIGEFDSVTRSFIINK